ncbi:unnamed protein product [Ilex paraguariensis]|uniref:Uncharacterized protein n=1 Tax=Ilex paraguariensis TaxID=185542 RepID=A0ABC8U801_9AQUA
MAIEGEDGSISIDLEETGVVPREEAGGSREVLSTEVGAPWAPTTLGHTAYTEEEGGEVPVAMYGGLKRVCFGRARARGSCPRRAADADLRVHHAVQDANLSSDEQIRSEAGCAKAGTTRHAWGTSLGMCVGVGADLGTDLGAVLGSPGELGVRVREVATWRLVFGANLSSFGVQACGDGCAEAGLGAQMTPIG